MHGSGLPSGWVTRFAPLLRPGGTVLDLACGSGRHLRWLAAQGFRVTGVDRDAAALATAAEGLPACETLAADIEAGPWPLPGRRFDGIVITNYLWRPLVQQVLDALAEGGVLIWETFAQGQQTIGKPSRADFLLQPGELLRLCAGLRIVAFEDGYEADPPRFVQRIAAVKAPDPAKVTPYGLHGAAS
jgi:SAM-dependent methyltransferase